jgi:hypothetical protein
MVQLRVDDAAGDDHDIERRMVLQAEGGLDPPAGHDRTELRPTVATTKIGRLGSSAPMGASRRREDLEGPAKSRTPASNR